MWRSMAPSGASHEGALLYVTAGDNNYIGNDHWDENLRDYSLSLIASELNSATTTKILCVGGVGHEGMWM